MSEAGPQVNGPSSPTGRYIDHIDPDDPEYIKYLQRPAEVKEDLQQMENRSRVKLILNSQAFKDELEQVVEEQLRSGPFPASLVALQQITDLLLPQSRGGLASLARASAVIPINDLRGVESLGFVKGEKLLRCKLAALYRLVDLCGWSHGIHNHITARVSPENEHFLVNPFGLTYSEVTASSLIKVDVKGNVLEQGSTQLGPYKPGFAIHAAIHQARPDIKCIVHLHTPAAVAISALKCGLVPMSQEALVCGSLSYHEFHSVSVDEEERERLIRNLGVHNKVLVLQNRGILACGESVEEAFHYTFNVMAACESQVKAMPLGLDNILIPSDEAQEQARKIGSQGGGGVDSRERKWKIGELEFEALMRTLDNSGYRTGYAYKMTLIKHEKKDRSNSEVEIPPASSSFTYIFDEDYLHSKYASPLQAAKERQKNAFKAGWLTTPNAYRKTEIDEIGTTTPKKITKWVSEGDSPARPGSTPPVKLENPNQFAPQGDNPKEFKLKQKSIKKDYYEERITAGPQSKILEGITWDEVQKAKDVQLSGAGDQVVVVGAASKGIIQRDHQHNAVVYRQFYAANPFENMSEAEIEQYQADVQRKERGEPDTEPEPDVEAEEIPAPVEHVVVTSQKPPEVTRQEEQLEVIPEVTNGLPAETTSQTPPPSPAGLHTSEQDFCDSPAEQGIVSGSMKSLQPIPVRLSSQHTVSDQTSARLSGQSTVSDLGQDLVCARQCVADSKLSQPGDILLPSSESCVASESVSWTTKFVVKELLSRYGQRANRIHCNCCLQDDVCSTHGSFSSPALSSPLVETHESRGGLPISRPLVQTSARKTGFSFSSMIRRERMRSSVSRAGLEEDAGSFHFDPGPLTGDDEEIVDWMGDLGALEDFMPSVGPVELNFLPIDQNLDTHKSQVTEQRSPYSETSESFDGGLFKNRKCAQNLDSCLSLSWFEDVFINTSFQQSATFNELLGNAETLVGQLDSGSDVKYRQTTNGTPSSAGNGSVSSQEHQGREAGQSTPPVEAIGRVDPDSYSNSITPSHLGNMMGSNLPSPQSGPRRDPHSEQQLENIEFVDENSDQEDEQLKKSTRERPSQDMLSMQPQLLPEQPAGVRHYLGRTGLLPPAAGRRWTRHAHKNIRLKHKMKMLPPPLSPIKEEFNGTVEEMEEMEAILEEADDSFEQLLISAEDDLLASSSIDPNPGQKNKTNIFIQTAAPMAIEEDDDDMQDFKLVYDFNGNQSAILRLEAGKGNSLFDISNFQISSVWNELHQPEYSSTSETKNIIQEMDTTSNGHIDILHEVTTDETNMVPTLDTLDYSGTLVNREVPPSNGNITCLCEPESEQIESEIIAETDGSLLDATVGRMLDETGGSMLDETGGSIFNATDGRILDGSSQSLQPGLGRLNIIGHVLNPLDPDSMLTSLASDSSQAPNLTVSQSGPVASLAPSFPTQKMAESSLEIMATLQATQPQPHSQLLAPGDTDYLSNFLMPMQVENKGENVDKSLALGLNLENPMETTQVVDIQEILGGGPGDSLRQADRGMCKTDDKELKKATTVKHQVRDEMSDGETAAKHRVRDEMSDGKKATKHRVRDGMSDGKTAEKHRVRDGMSDGKKAIKHRVRDGMSDGETVEKHRVRDEISDGETAAKHRVRDGMSDGKKATKHRVRDGMSDGETAEKHRVRDEMSYGETAEKHRVRDGMSDGKTAEKHRVRDEMSHRKTVEKHRVRDGMSDGNTAEQHRVRDLMCDGKKATKHRVRAGMSDGETVEKHRVRDGMSDGKTAEKHRVRDEISHRKKVEKHRVRDGMSDGQTAETYRLPVSADSQNSLSDSHDDSKLLAASPGLTASSVLTPVTGISSVDCFTNGLSAVPGTGSVISIDDSDYPPNFDLQLHSYGTLPLAATQNKTHPIAKQVEIPSETKTDNNNKFIVKGKSKRYEGIKNRHDRLKDTQNVVSGKHCDDETCINEADLVMNEKHKKRQELGGEEGSIQLGVDEGPIQTSSPKIGRATSKKSPFKPYALKLGKSEETLLEIMPLEGTRQEPATAKSQGHLDFMSKENDEDWPLSRSRSLGPHHVKSRRHQQSVPVSATSQGSIRANVAGDASQGSLPRSVLDKRSLLRHDELMKLSYCHPPVKRLIQVPGDVMPPLPDTTEVPSVSDSEGQPQFEDTGVRRVGASSGTSRAEIGARHPVASSQTSEARQKRVGRQKRELETHQQQVSGQPPEGRRVRQSRASLEKSGTQDEMRGRKGARRPLETNEKIRKAHSALSNSSSQLDSRQVAESRHTACDHASERHQASLDILDRNRIKGQTGRTLEGQGSESDLNRSHENRYREREASGIQNSFHEARKSVDGNRRHTSSQDRTNVTGKEQTLLSQIRSSRKITSEELKLSLKKESSMAGTEVLDNTDGVQKRLVNSGRSNEELRVGKADTDTYRSSCLLSTEGVQPGESAAGREKGPGDSTIDARIQELEEPQSAGSWEDSRETSSRDSLSRKERRDRPTSTGTRSEVRDGAKERNRKGSHRQADIKKYQGESDAVVHEMTKGNQKDSHQRKRGSESDMALSERELRGRGKDGIDESGQGLKHRRLRHDIKDRSKENTDFNDVEWERDVRERKFRRSSKDRKGIRGARRKSGMEGEVDLIKPKEEGDDLASHSNEGSARRTDFKDDSEVRQKQRFSHLKEGIDENFTRIDMKAESRGQERNKGCNTSDVSKSEDNNLRLTSQFSSSEEKIASREKRLSKGSISEAKVFESSENLTSHKNTLSKGSLSEATNSESSKNLDGFYNILKPDIIGGNNSIRLQEATKTYHSNLTSLSKGLEMKPCRSQVSVSSVTSLIEDQLDSYSRPDQDDRSYSKHKHSSSVIEQSDVLVQRNIRHEQHEVGSTALTDFEASEKTRKQLSDDSFPSQERQSERWRPRKEKQKRRSQRRSGVYDDDSMEESGRLYTEAEQVQPEAFLELQKSNTRLSRTSSRNSKLDLADANSARSTPRGSVKSRDLSLDVQATSTELRDRSALQAQQSHVGPRGRAVSKSLSMSHLSLSDNVELDNKQNELKENAARLTGGKPEEPAPREHVSHGTHSKDWRLPQSENKRHAVDDEKYVPVADKKGLLSLFGCVSGKSTCATLRASKQKKKPLVAPQKDSDVWIVQRIDTQRQNEQDRNYNKQSHITTYLQQKTSDQQNDIHEHHSSELLKRPKSKQKPSDDTSSSSTLSDSVDASKHYKKDISSSFQRVCSEQLLDSGETRKISSSSLNLMPASTNAGVSIQTCQRHGSRETKTWGPEKGSGANKQISGSPRVTHHSKFPDLTSNSYETKTFDKQLNPMRNVSSVHELDGLNKKETVWATSITKNMHQSPEFVCDEAEEPLKRLVDWTDVKRSAESRLLEKLTDLAQSDGASSSTLVSPGHSAEADSVASSESDGSLFLEPATSLDTGPAATSLHPAGGQATSSAVTHPQHNARPDRFQGTQPRQRPVSMYDSQSVSSQPASISSVTNPLIYEPWRVKAYQKKKRSMSFGGVTNDRSSGPRHRAHSIGEVCNSTVASSIARRRARTPVSSEITSRMYQRRQHNRSRSGDTSFSSFHSSRQHSFSGFDHSMHRREPPAPVAGVRRSDSARQPSQHPQILKELEHKIVERSKSERRPKMRELGDDKPASPSKSDTLKSTDSGGETLEDRSSKEGSPTKEQPSPVKEKKKKKKFRIPSFSSKKKNKDKESRESAS